MDYSYKIKNGWILSEAVIAILLVGTLLPSLLIWVMTIQKSVQKLKSAQAELDHINHVFETTLSGHIPTSATVNNGQVYLSVPISKTDIELYVIP